MKYDQFVRQVEARGSFDSREHAEKAVRATLSVLGSRLTGGETKDLASQLPPEIAAALPASGGGESFGVDEFLRRVGDQEGTGCSDADVRTHATAVLNTLSESVTEGELDDVRAQLPEDFLVLVG